MKEDPLNNEMIDFIRKKIMISEVPGHSKLLDFFKEKEND